MPKAKTKAPKKVKIAEPAEGFSAASVFILEKLAMDKYQQWTMKMILKTVLPQSYREYSVLLSVNETPFELRIEDLEKNRERVDNEQQLFSDQKNIQLRNIDNEIKSVQAELEDMRNACPDIEFEGSIISLKYKEGDTVIEMAIPAELIKELNQNRLNLKHYKIELKRQ